jgi:hypothetical protein
MHTLGLIALAGPVLLFFTIGEEGARQEVTKASENTAKCTAKPWSIEPN